LRIGELPAIRRWQTAEYRQLFWLDSSYGFLLLLEFLAGLALFAMHRADREHLWFGLYELCWVARHASFEYFDFHSHWLKAPDLVDLFCLIAGTLCFIQLVVSITRQHRGFLFWIAIASVAAYTGAIAIGVLDWISVDCWILPLGSFAHADSNGTAAIDGLYRIQKQSREYLAKLAGIGSDRRIV